MGWTRGGRAAFGAALVVVAASLEATGCSGGRGGGSSGVGASLSTPAAISSGATTAPTSTTSSRGSSPRGPAPVPVAGGSPAASPTPAPNFAQLASDFRARCGTFLDACATGNGAPNTGENIFTQIARLERNQGPLDLGAIDYSLGQIDQRQDTADFGANGAVRILSAYASSPLLPRAELDHLRDSLVGFRYWLDEPGPCAMTYWSENHQILFATAEYLAGNLYPATVFPNAGLTGAQHAQKARARILRWLAARERWGMSEWFSPVYYEYDLLPLLNLVDFAPDADIRTRASMVVDVILFDLARLTNRGSFAVTAGRAYAEQKFTSSGQSVGDTIQLLWGTRGGYEGRGSPSAVSLAVSSYKVPHALLGIGLDRPARFLDRSRQGLSFADAASAGVGFQSLEDGVFWWGMGAYTDKETIVLSKQMYTTWGLSTYDALKQIFDPLQYVPDFLLPALSDTLSPLSEGSFLETANVTCFRTPDAMLSSTESWRKGQVGFQAHAWQATLGTDATVFTTMPGNFPGHDGPNEWTGSGSLPRCVQVGNVCVVLYDSGLAERVLFPQRSHAYFPQAAFDEVASQGKWTFGRKGQGYVALYSDLPTTWTTSGTYANAELVAQGPRNVWICQVGREAEDGSFAAFQAKVASAGLAVVGSGWGAQDDPLTVTYEPAGVGKIEADWANVPRVNGAPLDESHPRWDDDYAKVPAGSDVFTIQFGGATLSHDGPAGTRSGTGL